MTYEMTVLLSDGSTVTFNVQARGPEEAVTNAMQEARERGHQPAFAYLTSQEEPQ